MNNHCGYVAIVGRPNVGKSTLLNRLVGQKLAITSHKPQTTRHSIIGVNTVANGQLVYVDTPGIHKRGDQPMNRYLNRTAKASLFGVEVILFVVEAKVWTEEDQVVLEAIISSEIPAFVAINKMDKISDKSEILPFMQRFSGIDSLLDIVPVSALKGQYIDELEQMILPQLPHQPNIYPEDQLTDRSSRFLAAELVREQLTRLYDKELPYSLTVEIERWEDEGALLKIHALVWVEKDGQKKILIGKKGEAIKEVGKRARQSMETLFDKKVFLNIWIKVKRSWSSDERALANLGYSNNDIDQ